MNSKLTTIIMTSHLIVACGVVPGLAAQKDPKEACSGYPQVAAYILPWDTSVRGVVLESNCGRDQNKGEAKYAYKFSLPLGSTILASRAGTITSVDFSVEPGTTSSANFIEITHGDGTVARYVHLSNDSSRADVGSYVPQGQPIATTGDTGLRGEPSLYFEVVSRRDGYNLSLPISFSNAGKKESPLTENVTYPALATEVL